MVTNTIFYEKTEINIGFGIYGGFKKEINEIKKDPKNHLLFIYQKHILDWILNTKIIFDEENILKIKREIKLTEKGKKEIISRFYRELEKNLLIENPSINVEIKRKNYLFIQHLIQKSVTETLEILYTLNNKLYKYPKWALKDLKEFKNKPADTIKIIQKISKLGNSKKDLERKINLIKLLIKKIHPLIKKFII